MTDKTQPPSAAALRAAEAVIVHEHGGVITDPEKRTYAELCRIYDGNGLMTNKRLELGHAIDRETGLPELVEFVRRWHEIIVGGDKPSRLEGWAQEFYEEARALLQRHRGPEK